MKAIIFILSGLLSLNAFAKVDVDTDGLTNAQKATLIQQVEQMKTEAAPAIKATSKSIVETADKWVDLGEHIGKALGGTAKEIGVEVNAFVKTPVGQLATVLIVWNYMGGMIIHVVSGWGILILSLSSLFVLARKLQRVEIEYDKSVERNWLGNYPILKVTRSPLSDDDGAIFLVGTVLSFVISIFVIFTW
jgi:hypothetical protein